MKKAIVLLLIAGIFLAGCPQLGLSSNSLPPMEKGKSYLVYCAGTSVWGTYQESRGDWIYLKTGGSDGCWVKIAHIGFVQPR